MKTFFCIISFGCKINQYEGHKIKEQLFALGLQETEDYRNAHLCIVNTCTVTARADQKTRRLLRKIHGENPEAMIIVTGCYGTAKADREELLKIPGVAYVVSNYEKMTIPELYAQATGKKFIIRPQALTPFSLDRSRAYLKIQDGCNLMCTFCKIPYVRNQLTSKKPEDVIEEARIYAEHGFREIVLTGVHLGLYGYKEAFSERYHLPSLLWKLSQIEGLERIRISSIEANEITQDLVDVVKDSQKICPHFHIPLQSGDNRILKLMNRKYTREEFLEKIELLKSELDQPGLTTDVIYGFPTEDEKNFENTLEIIQKSGFHRIHAFPFSPRRRTPAYKLEPKVPPKIMKIRKQQLLGLAEKLEKEYCHKFLGRTERVLLESQKDPITGLWMGYTDRYLRCSVRNGEGWQNRVFPVRIVDMKENGVIGERICQSPITINQNY